jgi:ABC-type branched-subunit amino acid transport system substrate-binding protein
MTALVLSACVPMMDGLGGGTGSRTPVSASSEADQAYDRGDYAAAAAGYKRVLDSGEAGARRETLLGMYGLASERSGKYIQAAQAYQTLIAEFPRGEYSGTVKLRIPDLYLLGNRPVEALSQAESLYAVETVPASKAALKLSSGRAQFIQGKYRDALISFILAIGGASSATRDAAGKGLEASLLNMREAELVEVQRQYGQNYPGPEASWYLARQAALAKNPALFTERADYFKRYFGSHPWGPKLEALRIDPNSLEARAPGSDYDPKPILASAASPERSGPTLGQMGGLKGQAVIGALLPLSDPQSSKFSQDVLTGLKIALASLGSRVTIETMDTGNDPGRVVQLVSEAAARPEILALVGPLTSREALAAAQTAQSVGIPLVTVSQRLGITTGRPMVFRVFLTPKHQAEAVARYAVRTLRLTDLGVLYPADPYGQAMQGFFLTEARRLGGRVTASDSYDPVQRGYNEPVNRLTGGQSVRRASTNYQANVNFQALFVPDTAAAIAQILPLMAYNDVTRMVYLGSSIWLTQDLAKNSGRYLKGAVIPDSFNSLSKRSQAVKFGQAFNKVTGRQADQFAAYGHDAGLALATAIGAGAGTRSEIVNALLAIKPYEGATGPFGFGPDGDYQVEPLMVTVEGTKFELLAEPSQYR